MQVLVTVGTTKFESLVREVDKFDSDEDNLEIQIADGTYLPKRHNWFRFTEHIDKYYTAADLVICHAGAGTVYRLLELNKALILVPNCERDDNHQLDLFHYMTSNKYAFGIASPAGIWDYLSSIRNTLDELVPYPRNKFYGVETLLNCLRLNC